MAIAAPWQEIAEPNGAAEARGKMAPLIDQMTALTTGPLRPGVDAPCGMHVSMERTVTGPMPLDKIDEPVLVTWSDDAERPVGSAGPRALRESIACWRESNQKGGSMLKHSTGLTKERTVPTSVRRMREGTSSRQNAAPRLDDRRQPAPSVLPARSAGDSWVVAQVNPKALGPRIPRSFVGFSVEFGGWSAEHYLVHRGGDRPEGGWVPNSTVVQLFDNLRSLQGPPMLRVGGNSTDKTVWRDQPGEPKSTEPAIVVTRRWLQETQALAAQTGASLILGVNLASNDPRRAVEWVQAAWNILGPEMLYAFEIGNEPNYFLKHGLRSAPFGFAEYSRQFQTYVEALRAWNPRVPLAGPVTSDAAPRYLSEESWAQYLPEFLGQFGERLALVSYHRYPLNRCHTSPGARRYPTLSQLVSARAAGLLGREALGYVRAAERYGLPTRVSELNSIACGGAPGLSDTMASALWAIDTLFHLARAGISGVNFHVGGYQSRYAPFRLTTTAEGEVETKVYPLYYGLVFFAQAVQQGARLASVTTSGMKDVQVWATCDDRGKVRVMVLNKAPARPANLVLCVPGGSQGRLTYLTAPSMTASTGVTLAGQTYDGTPDGHPHGRYRADDVRARGGRFVFSVRAASAALLVVEP